MPPRRSVAISTKRTRTYITSAFIALLLFIVFRSKRAPPPLPPLPGTYQYFAETDFHNADHHFGGVSHCDSRFVPVRPPEISEVRKSLHTLLQSYVATMDELKVESWISHGALLGWYWNRKLLPWDTDLDVQMSAESLGFLAKSHNMTEYRYPSSGEDSSRKYLLDINPHYSIVSQLDVANKIDGRWIDTTDGKFIDITAVHIDPSEANRGKSRMLHCKDGHKYKAGTPFLDQVHLTHVVHTLARRHLPTTSIDTGGNKCQRPVRKPENPSTGVWQESAYK
ncbi:MAG: hypothetical protein Q9160_004875 [Pyrenula sp. 1 TL-2023]